MNADMANEPHDVEEKTRLTLSQHLAFKSACSDIGIKKADVLRALILNFLRDHHKNTSLRSIGLQSTSYADTE